MKNIRKITALILAVLMLVSVFAGCRSVGGTNSEDGNKTVNLVVYSQLANYNGVLTGWFAEVLKEKFNVEITIIPDADGVYATRMESGDLGDIVVWGNNGKDYKAAAEGGYLLDWEDGGLVEEYGPYIYENMQAALENNRSLTSTGEVYGFGHSVATSVEDHQDFFYTWDVRYDLYKAIGSPEIKDLDDLYDAFVAMKEICPTGDDGNETYAVSIWPDWDGDMVMYVKSTATAYYGYDEFGCGLYSPIDGSFHAALEEDSPYIEMLRWYNKLYNAGLVDPDSPTQTFDKMSEKVENGRTFFSIFNYAGYMTYNTSEHLEAGKGMFSISPEDATPIVYGMSNLGGNRIWSIGSKTQYPELCMQIINWLCTPEGRLTSDYGPKGVCWDYDENGKTYFTELGLKCKKDRNTDMAVETQNQYTGLFGDASNQINNTTWDTNATNPESGELYNCEYWASYLSMDKSEIEKDWMAWASEQTGIDVVTNQDYLGASDYVLVTYPGVSFVPAELDDDLNFKSESIKTVVKNYSYQALVASEAEFDSIIEKARDEVYALGYQELIDFYTVDAARRFAAEQSVY